MEAGTPETVTETQAVVRHSHRGGKLSCSYASALNRVLETIGDRFVSSWRINLRIETFGRFNRTGKMMNVYAVETHHRAIS